jgi:hypothetical protein
MVLDQIDNEQFYAEQTGLVNGDLNILTNQQDIKPIMNALDAPLTASSTPITQKLQENQHLRKSPNELNGNNTNYSFSNVL